MVTEFSRQGLFLSDQFFLRVCAYALCVITICDYISCICYSYTPYRIPVSVWFIHQEQLLRLLNLFYRYHLDQISSFCVCARMLCLNSSYVITYLICVYGLPLTKSLCPPVFLSQEQLMWLLKLVDREMLVPASPCPCMAL